MHVLRDCKGSRKGPAQYPANVRNRGPVSSSVSNNLVSDGCALMHERSISRGAVSPISTTSRACFPPEAVLADPRLHSSYLTTWRYGLHPPYRRPHTPRCFLTSAGQAAATHPPTQLFATMMRLQPGRVGMQNTVNVSSPYLCAGGPGEARYGRSGQRLTVRHMPQYGREDVQQHGSAAG